jgi:hypothetical protein
MAVRVAVVPRLTIVAVAPTITPPVESAIIIAMTVVPVIPRPCADKYAAHEPIRAVVSVRRTRVRIIRIVSVSADRWAIHRVA